jgi:hypothetical protein
MEDCGVGCERDHVDDHAERSAPSGVRPTASAMDAVQQAVGNAGVGRLLASPGGARALQRLTAAPALARWPWSKQPELLPDEPVEIKREFELDPTMFTPKMEAHAEREREGKHPPTPQKLEPGDHVWYYAHPDPDVPRITADLDVSRDLWFPARPARLILATMEAYAPVRDGNDPRRHPRPRRRGPALGDP